jgi:hypothetical protein
MGLAVTMRVWREKHMGFVTGCIDPAMVISLVVKLLDFFFLLFMCIAKS